MSMPNQSDEIEKMKKTWDENIESFLKQIDEKLTIRDNRLNNHWDKIEGLEKKFKELEDVVSPAYVQTICDKREIAHNEQIAELRNQIQNNSIVDLNHYNALKEGEDDDIKEIGILREQIAELQLKCKIYDVHVVSENYQYPMIYKLEKVLRDHLKSHIVVARDQLTNKDKIIIFREFDKAIEDQLKKLDAPKEQDIRAIDINIYKNGLLDDRIAIKGEMFRKDSRGEKETTIGGLGGLSLSKSPMITHSKLPETEPEKYWTKELARED